MQAIYTFGTQRRKLANLADAIRGDFDDEEPESVVAIQLELFGDEAA